LEERVREEAVALNNPARGEEDAAGRGF